MFGNKKQKLDPRVKYEQPQFKKQLQNARAYKRVPASSGNSVFLRILKIARRVPWKLALGVVIATVLAVYICFVPNFLFITTITVQGGTDKVAADVEQQATRFLHTSHFGIPRRNMLFVPSQELATFLAAANTHVWRVDEVKKQWPNKLSIRITSRVPVYKFNISGQEIVVANDGSVLPKEEAPYNSQLLLVSAQTGSFAEVGGKQFSGELLATLSSVKNNFTALVNLPSPTKIELVPVMVAAPSASILPTNSLPPQGITPTHRLEQVALNVPPEEVRVFVPPYANSNTPAFTVLLPVSEDTNEVLIKLHALLASQTAERMKNLEYVDMRFSSRAFICLKGTPCVNGENTVQVSAVPTPTKKP